MANSCDRCSRLGIGVYVRDTFYAKNKRREEALGALPQSEKKSTFDKLKSCAAAQYGFGNGNTPTGLDVAKIASEIGSLPIFKPLAGIPVIGDSSRFTNVLNYTSFKLGLSGRFEGADLRNFTRISGVGYGNNVSWLAATLNQGLGPSAFKTQISKMAEALKQCN